MRVTPYFWKQLGVIWQGDSCQPSQNKRLSHSVAGQVEDSLIVSGRRLDVIGDRAVHRWQVVRLQRPIDLAVVILDRIAIHVLVDHRRRDDGHIRGDAVGRIINKRGAPPTSSGAPKCKRAYIHVLCFALPTEAPHNAALQP